MQKLINAIYVCLFAAILSFSSQTNALKVNTHVWVAQEIINDLSDDGKLTIFVDGDPVEITVNYRLKNYILNHQKEFRAGSLGPDAFPDILVGQVSIHPGSKQLESQGKTWNTDQWLKFIMDNATNAPEKSFAYGNLVHAASDVMAHSYVNMYAGEIFDVLEHATIDTEPDRRHFLLESYIGNLTPNLGSGLNYKDSVTFPDTKKYIAQRKEQELRRCEMDNREPGVNFDCNKMISRMTFGDTRDFLSRTFIYDPSDIKQKVAEFGSSTNSPVYYPEGIQQYMNALGEGTMGGAHLAAIYQLRYRIEQLIQSDVLKEMDENITRAVVYYWTDYEISDGQAEVLNNILSELQQVAYDDIENLQRIKNKIEDIVDNSTMKINSITQSAALVVDRHNQILAGIQGRIFDLENEVLDLHSRIQRATCPRWDPICNAISRLESKLRKAKRKLESEMTNYLSNKNILTNAITQLHQTLQSINLVRRSLDNAAIDLAQVLLKDINPIRAVLINWSEGIDSAMHSYRIVGMQMMQEAMIGGNSVAPIEKWAFTDCNVLKLLGVGDEFGTSLCNLNRNYDAMATEIDELMPYITNGILLGNIHKDLKRLFIDKLKKELKEYLLAKAEDKLGPEMIAFLEGMAKNVDGQRLDEEFRKGSDGGQGYLNIADMSKRVKAEMRVVTGSTACNGKSQCFSKSKYPLIYNAVQFSKLALLGEAELAQLASLSNGKVNLLDGNNHELTSNSTFDTSILFNALNSIDGNHQWLGKKSPPLPKDKSYSQSYSWSEKHYGHNNGKLLGASAAQRQKIMFSLFKGPLNEGLFTPKALGFVNEASLLTTTYRQKFDECKGHIFQLSSTDHFCNSVEDVYVPPVGDDDDDTGGGVVVPPRWDNCGGNTGIICP
jgi:hypothetical protein